MDVRRREFLKWTIYSSALIALPVRIQAGEVFANNRRRTPSILQGASDETHAQFSILNPGLEDFTVHVRTASGQNIYPDVSDDLSQPSQPYRLRRAGFSGLSLGETYQLEVVGVGGQLLDQREFQTLDLEKHAGRFALCSCMDEKRHSPEIWRDLWQQKPDLLLFVGDAVYCDDGSQTGTWIKPETMFRRFCEVRTTLEVYYQKSLIPILATWDDHDFAQDNTGGWQPFVTEAQANFKNFFAQDPRFCRTLQSGPGVSTKFDFAGQRFLLLDDRSERTKAKSGHRYGHWGQKQEDWLIESVENFAGPTWLMNGSQFFPAMTFKESVSADHPEQLKELVLRLQKSGKKILFGSGDVHYSEVSALEPAILGYASLEVTSSSIHSYKLPGLPGLIKNARRVASTGEHNYCLVESSATAQGGCAGRVESRSPYRKVNFVHNFEV
jgi:alkaline phosphatase D